MTVILTTNIDISITYIINHNWVHLLILYVIG